MGDTSLSDIGTLRVMRSTGNLRVQGTNSNQALIRSAVTPEVRTLDRCAEVLILGDAEIEVPAGVAVDIVDCGGSLEGEDYSGLLSLGSIRGNLYGRRIGSVVIRGEVDGEVRIEQARVVEGARVNGSVQVKLAKSIKFVYVGRNVDCREIEGDAVFEEVLGRMWVINTTGGVRVGRVAGKLQVERVKSLEASIVAARVKAVEVSGDVRLAKVVGRLSAENVGGCVCAESVGGHVRIRGVHGAVVLPDVSGAIDLLGQFPTEGGWRISSRGRISMEVGSSMSATISAAARYGRVRTYGLPEGAFIHTGSDRVEGRLGAGGLKLSLTAHGADVIICGEGAESRDYDGRRRAREFRFGRRFTVPIEAFAEDLREDLPEFVSEFMGAAGRIVSGRAKFKRGFAQEVTRGVGDAVREMERAISDLESRVPHDLGEKLSSFGRKVSDVVDRAMGEARERWREHGDSDAARRPQSTARREASGQPAAEDEESDRPQADDTLLKILQGVREGTISPEEADRLISAWAELQRATDKQAE